MAKKQLGQLAPAAATPGTLYTVPASKEAVASSFTACNYGATTSKIRMRVRIGGVADANQQRRYWDLPIAPNDTFIATIGMTLAAADEVRVESDTGNVAFSLDGDEADI